MTGIIVQYLLFSISFSRLERRPLLPSLFDTSISEPFIETCGVNTTVEAPYLRPGLGNSVFAQEDAWTRKRIDDMVRRTKGFLARDWPLHLGWNNVSTPSFTAVFQHSLGQIHHLVAASVYTRSGDAGS